ncbi:MAG TPA: AAA family ATPase, partial [Acidimicrobiia bacterium]
MTVLFTDLAGSTDLMGRLGEPVYDARRRAHFASLREAISEHGGDEVKRTGDGVLALFASAVDAVHCAVTMQQSTEWQSRSGPGPLALRVGLSLGEVVLESDDVFGTPVVEAARLLAVAEGGQVLATSLVRAVAVSRAAVRFDDRPPVTLKGLPEPVPICEVLWRIRSAEVPLPPAMAVAPHFAFVGRAPEMDRLRSLWEEAQRDERRVVLVAGEPGVGKTRLAVEVARAVHAEGAVVLAGRCDEGLGVSYQPFVEALRHHVENTPPAKLAARLGRLGGELTRLVPEISSVVPGLPPPLQSDPETERYRLFDAVAAWLAALSHRGPIMLVLDDLQWAARATLLLLRHVVQVPAPMRLLVVGTYRDTELDRDHPLTELLADLRRATRAERLALSGLDATEVAAFITAEGHSLAEEMVSAIHAETQGNPFFVGELLHHLNETGTLGVPEGVREIVGRRLSRLSRPANQVLSVAAVAGEEFESAVLAIAGDMDQGRLFDALEEAMAARLLDEATRPSPRFRFTHALVRASLYEELSPSRRQALHLRVGEAIEKVHPVGLDDYAPALCHHFALGCVGGATAPAVRYAARAGDRALALLASDEAVGYYRRALDLLHGSREKTDDALRCDLLISLGEAQRRAGHADYRKTLLDAAHLAGELGDAGRLAQAALANHRAFFSLLNEVDDERVLVVEAALDALGPGDSTTRARLLVTLASELVFATEPERRLQLAAAGLDMARRLGDLSTLADVLVRGYIPTFTSLDISALRAHTAELGTVAERLGDPALAFWASTWGFMTAVVAADLAAAGPLIATSTKAADAAGQPFLRFIATAGRSHLSRIHGQLAEAEALAYEAFVLNQASGQPDAFRFFGIQLFWIRYDQGRLAETVELFAKAMRRDRPSPLPRAAYCLTLC